MAICSGPPPQSDAEVLAKDALANCGEIRQKLDAFSSEHQDFVAHTDSLERRLAEVEAQNAIILERLAGIEASDLQKLQPQVLEKTSAEKHLALENEQCRVWTTETVTLQKMIDDALSGNRKAENEELRKALNFNVQSQKQEFQEAQKVIVQKSSALVQKKQELLAEAVERRLSQEGEVLQAQAAAVTQDLDRVRQRQDALATQLERRLQGSERRTSEVLKRASEPFTGIPNDVQVALVKLEHTSESKAHAEARAASVDAQLSSLQKTLGGFEGRLNSFIASTEHSFVKLGHEMAHQKCSEEEEKFIQTLMLQAEDFSRRTEIASQLEGKALQCETQDLKGEVASLAQRLQDGLHLAAEAVTEGAEANARVESAALGAEEAIQLRLQEVASEAKETYDAQKVFTAELADIRTAGHRLSSGDTKARALRLQAQLRAVAGLVE
eukprot:gnl/MRDRNA2_/MRDRNA2_121678_c0_seq1.p1 gnl/MRDRNA2_/MRDRNA2_121678_c0~~gnl/MRDRNA2_/MRDRNA2_121678_c0_seq1.p1  ORF type:complete len:441 (+),score=136.38 gnl/MRDRNA2_/MRDRNA2_121678_c0_seq1:69-1391(+)